MTPTTSPIVVVSYTKLLLLVAGIAVVAVMVITTCLVSLIMLTEWKTKLRWVAGFFGVFFVVESIYLSSVLYKFAQGGYLPLAFSVFLMTIMGIWHYVHKQRYVYELNNKLPADYVKELVVNSNVNRVPGMGLLYSELVQGIPPIFPHFVANIPSIHSVLVFVSIKSIPISKVLLEERFLFRRVEPRDLNMYRCVVRYGYRDQIEEAEEFQRQLVENLKEFIRNELLINGAPTAEQMADPAPEILAGAEEEMQFVQRARENGVVYLLGEADVVAEPNSSLFKKILVNYVYNFLRKNFRQGEKFLAIPQSKLLRVGMTYEI